MRYPHWVQKKTIYSNPRLCILHTRKINSRRSRQRERRARREFANKIRRNASLSSCKSHFLPFQNIYTGVEHNFVIVFVVRGNLWVMVRAACESLFSSLAVLFHELSPTFSGHFYVIWIHFRFAVSILSLQNET